MKLSADMTSPSTGIFSPARTSSTSPTSTVERGTSSSLPSLRMRAVLGCIPMSWRMDEAVPSLAFSSSSRPVRTKVMIITEASK